MKKQETEHKNSERKEKKIYRNKIEKIEKKMKRKIFQINNSIIFFFKLEGEYLHKNRFLSRIPFLGQINRN